jgi:hypothetical protein
MGPEKPAADPALERDECSSGTHGGAWLAPRNASGRHAHPRRDLGRAVLLARRALVFWDVHESENAIAIELLDERYDKLVIEVENPRQDILRIRKAVSSLSTHAAPV